MESAEPLRSTARLRRDHEKITGVLDAVEALTRRLRRGRDVPPATIIGALDFFAAFVDRCHRVKEEEGLLPLLRQRGMPDDSSLARAEAEHGEARRLLSRLRQVGTRGKIDAEGTAWLETYVALLRRHMAAEEAVLFPLADRVLSSADDARLLRSFLHVERHSVGPAGLAAAFALAEAVTDACREIGVERANRQRDARAGHAVRPKLATVAPEDSLAQALELMEAVGTRELPVVEGGVLVGILARRDLEPHRGQYEWTPVRSAMTPDPVTVDAATPIRVVVRLLLERSFNGVPVVAGGTLVGMRCSRSAAARVPASHLCHRRPGLIPRHEKDGPVANDRAWHGRCFPEAHGFRHQERPLRPDRSSFAPRRPGSGPDRPGRDAESRRPVDAGSRRRSLLAPGPPGRRASR